MVINFLVNEIQGGWSPTDIRLGGTEDSVVRWAEELNKRGHVVTVYRNKGTEPLFHNGVNYTGRENYTRQNAAKFCINVKSPEVAPLVPTLYLTNETDAGKHDLSKYEGVIWCSQWAVDNIPTNAKQTFILPYGYDSKKIYPGQKIRCQCFYGSSPDRGLDTLLNVWPDIHMKHPEAILILTYGAQVPSLDGVMNLGVVDEETMNEIYQISDFWLHPCNGGELYCITGIKAQAAGCIPVVIPRMALSETVVNGYWADNEANYFDALDGALSAPDKEIGALRQELAKHHFPDWEDSTNRLEEIIGLVTK